MKQRYVAVAAGLLGLGSSLAGCSEKPPVEARLPAEVLAWQPYRAGQVLG